MGTRIPPSKDSHFDPRRGVLIEPLTALRVVGPPLSFGENDERLVELARLLKLREHESDGIIHRAEHGGISLAFGIRDAGKRARYFSVACSGVCTR